MTTLDARLALCEKHIWALTKHGHLSGEPTVPATLSTVSPPMYPLDDEGRITPNINQVMADA